MCALAGATCASAGHGQHATQAASGRLEEMEYLLVHRGGRGQSFVYELLYEGGAAMVSGSWSRPDRHGKAWRSGDYDSNKRGEREKRQTGRAVAGPKSGGGRGDETARSSRKNRAFARRRHSTSRKHTPGKYRAAAIVIVPIFFFSCFFSALLSLLCPKRTTTTSEDHR